MGGGRPRVRCRRAGAVAVSRAMRARAHSIAHAGTGVAIRPPARLERALVAADRARRVTAGRFDPRVLGDLERLGYRGAALGPADAGRGRRTTERAGPAGRSSRRPGGTVSLRSTDRPRRHRQGSRAALGRGAARTARRRRLPARSGRRPRRPRGRDPTAAHGGSGSRIRPEPTGHPRRRSPLDERRRRDLVGPDPSLGARRAASVHHLLDPRTGEPADGGLLAVTVAGPDPAWAEVWSKALFLGGREAIAREARALGPRGLVGRRGRVARR